MQARGERRGHAAAAARQDPQERRRSRGWQIDARRGRHLLRQARRGRSLRRRRHRRTSGCPIRSTRRTPTACSRCSIATRSVVHRRSPRRRARLVGRRCSAPGASVDVLVKVDVGFHRCGIDPERPMRARLRRARSRELPGLRFRGLLSHAGHGYGATSEDELRAIARARSRDADGAARTRCAATGRRARRDQRRRDADGALQRSSRTGSPSCGPATTSTSTARRSALGAATLGRLRADRARARRQPSRRADRIILDCGSKTLTNDLARGFAPTPGYGAVLRATRRRRRRRTTSLLDRAAVGGARDRPRASGDARARARRSRPHRPESLVRGVEPGRRGLAGRRRRRCVEPLPRSRRAAGSRSRLARRMAKDLSGRSARHGRDARPRRHDRSGRRDGQDRQRRLRRLAEGRCRPGHRDRARRRRLGEGRDRCRRRRRPPRRRAGRRPRHRRAPPTASTRSSRSPSAGLADATPGRSEHLRPLPPLPRNPSPSARPRCGS